MRESRLISLALFEIPIFIALIFLGISLKNSKISYRFYRELPETHPREILKFLKNPRNLLTWMDLSHPRIKSITPRTDSRGAYTQITFGDLDYELNFKMRFNAAQSYKIDAGGVEIWQVKYTMESEFLSLSFDHLMNEMPFTEGGSMFTTKISAEMEGSILGLSFFLGRLSLRGILEEGFGRLVKELSQEGGGEVALDDVVKQEKLIY